MRRTHAHPLETGSGLEEEDSPRYHVAPRGLLFFYALLSIGRKPMTGYDLMREVEDKTGGAWRPGPGAVYPTLKKLARRGYVKDRKKSGEGPTQVSYEITPAGLRSIVKAKRAMESSGERMRMMSSLFIDLMEPDDLVKFALSSFELQAGLVRTIVESEKSRLSDEDKLFVLRQYKLNLDRERTRNAASISALEGGLEREAAKSMAKRGRA
jgi:DNA-binding PadR family transcriptional regulator